MFADSFGALNRPASEPPKDAVVVVECQLEEFYNGSLKHVVYEIDEVQHDARTIKRVTKTYDVQVNPGYGVDTVLSFKGLGNQAPNQPASNLVIKFSQKHNSSYTRKGDDLILTHDIRFEEVLNNSPIRIQTLDGRNLTHCFDELINPQTVRLITGEGMPRTQP